MVFKHIRKEILTNIQTFKNPNTIRAVWFPGRNWGDALNPVIIQFLSGKEPVFITKYTINPLHKPVYSVVGSILGMHSLNVHIKDIVIWGSGFISQSGKLAGTPKSICAVRGPLTRELLIHQGISCPEIFGDPALLYPMFYKPDIPKKFKLGIIPHYIDKDCCLLEQFRDIPEIIIIDIEGETNDVIDQICSCRNIASSSLHGIIAADAYGIPSTWIKFTDKVTGNGFKFQDYFHSVSRLDESPLVITDTTTIDDILCLFYRYRVDIDLDELLEACPFKAR